MAPAQPTTKNTAPTQARVDSWTWAVRLFKTRSAAAAACRGGHVRVNGVAAKPAQPVRPGDEVRVRAGGIERIVIVERVITKRVGPPIAAQCLIDRSPPPPPREILAAMPRRDRGSGRPTKRERRETDRLLGSPASPNILPAAGAEQPPSRADRSDSG